MKHILKQIIVILLLMLLCFLLLLWPRGAHAQNAMPADAMPTYSVGEQTAFSDDPDMAASPAASAATETEQPEEEAQQSSEEILQQGVDEAIEGLDLGDLEDLYNETENGYNGLSLEQAIRQIAQNGLSELTLEDGLNALFAALKNYFLGNWHIVVEIIAILLLTGLLRHMGPNAGKDGVGEVAGWAGYIMVAMLAATILLSCVKTTISAIDTLGKGVQTITPVLMVLLTGMGDISTASVLSPVMAGLTGGIFTIVQMVVIPLILVNTVLSMASGVSGTLRLHGFVKTINSVIKWLLGILFVVFLGITAMKGIAGGAIDGISFKTAKYTVDKMVPVIGGMFSDTLETLMACSLIVKNAVGIIGLLILVLLVGTPLISLLCNMFMLRIAGAAADMFASKEATGLLESMAGTVQLLFATLLCVSAMVFIFIAMVMGAADMSAMMR